MTYAMDLLDEVRSRPGKGSHPYLTYNRKRLPSAWACCDPCMAHRLLKHHQAMMKRLKQIRLPKGFERAIKDLNASFNNVKDFLVQNDRISTEDYEKYKKSKGR